MIKIKPISLLAGLAIPLLMGMNSATMALTPAIVSDIVVANTNEDGKTYPGTMCLPAQGHKVANSTTGVLYNDSNTPQTWTCPIVRDVMSGNDVNGITTAVVKGLDNHPSQDISCSLKSLSFHGGPVVQENDTSADGNIAFAGIQSFANGQYVLRCSVPGKHGNSRSGIRVYRINEKL